MFEYLFLLFAIFLCVRGGFLFCLIMLLKQISPLIKQLVKFFSSLFVFQTHFINSVLFCIEINGWRESFQKAIGGQTQKLALNQTRGT